MNDQPFTCPYCGSRSLEIANFYHTNSKLLIEECLNEDCSFIFGEVEDEGFLSGNYNPSLYSNIFYFISKLFLLLKNV